MASKPTQIPQEKINILAKFLLDSTITLTHTWSYSFQVPLQEAYNILKNGTEGSAKMKGEEKKKELHKLSLAGNFIRAFQSNSGP